MKGWTQQDIDAHQRKYGRYRGPKSAQETPRPPDAQEQGPKADSKVLARKKPNKTELAYYEDHCMGLDARYEALSFRMRNGKSYKPDWVVFQNGAPIACIEVKGSYQHHSHQRARLAFAQCKIEFEGIRWIWATKTKQGWRIEE